MRILRQADREGTPAGVPPGDPVRGVQAAGGTPLSVPARPRRGGLLLAAAVFVLAADALSQSVVLSQLSDHSPVRLRGGLLTITLPRNGGAPFGIGTSITIVVTAIAAG